MANEKIDTPVTFPSAGNISVDLGDKAPSDPPSPKFMTAEDFNGAMTSRDRRLANQQAKQLEEFKQSIMAMFQSAKPGAEDADVDGSNQDVSDQSAPKRPSGAELAAKKAMAKLDAVTKQMQAKEEAAAKEKAELLKRQERSETLAALTDAGSSNAKGAYALLKDEGRIIRNADGDLVMKVMKEYGEEEVPVNDGVKLWLATDEGKHYMPPRGGGEGSGTVVRGGASRTGGTLSKEEAKREAQRMLTQFVLGNNR